MKNVIGKYIEAFGVRHNYEQISTEMVYESRLFLNFGSHVVLMYSPSIATSHSPLTADTRTTSIDTWITLALCQAWSGQLDRAR